MSWHGHVLASEGIGGFPLPGKPCFVADLSRALRGGLREQPPLTFG